jgi:hypothetical protein
VSILHNDRVHEAQHRLRDMSRRMPFNTV